MSTGSDAIDGGIKAIVVQRQAVRHALAIRGAAGIIALRTRHASGRWDELWTTRPARLPAAI